MLMPYIPNRYRSLGFRSFALPVPLQENPLIKSTSLALTRSCDTLLANPATSLVFTAVGIIVFALWGFLPLMRDIRNRFDHGGNWKKSRTYLVSSSYLQPLLLWTGATLICRNCTTYNSCKIHVVQMGFNTFSVFLSFCFLLFIFLCQCNTGVWIQLCCLQQQVKL